MWRSIIVYESERISVEKGFVVITNNESKNKIPIDDLNCIVIDNMYTAITMQAIARLSQNNITVIACDSAHFPSSQILPLNNNYHCYQVLKSQISLSKDDKNIMWDKIIEAKIVNQANVLKNNDVKDDVINRMYELSKEVKNGDSGNREGIAAKMFFRNLYGSSFIRFNDDEVNFALNYGYAILRSTMATALVSYGFNLCLGIHHISETNPYNLADDFIEPFRPIVDDYVHKNHIDLVVPLSKKNKTELVNIVNDGISFDGKTTKVRYAINEMAKSFISCIQAKNFNILKVPTIICDREE